MCENQSPPPPRSSGLSRLFNPRFPGLKIRYRYAVTWTCDRLSWFSFISNLITIDITPSTSVRLEPRVSVFPFFQSLCFLWRAAFCPSRACCQSCLQALFLFVNCRESSSLFWPSGPPSGCLGCCPLGWQPDSPLALSLRLLASAELCSTRPASPAWSSREPSDLSGLDPGDPLGLMQDVPWALSRIPYSWLLLWHYHCNYGTKLVICTDVLKVS